MNNKDYLYRKYAFEKNKCKKLELKNDFQNFESFKIWANVHNYKPNMYVIKKDIHDGFVRDNIELVFKDVAIERYRKKKSTFNTEKQKQLCNVFEQLKQTHIQENEAVIINLVALKTKETFCNVYKAIKKLDIENNKFDNRKAYKRAWLLFKKNYTLPIDKP